MRYSGEFSRTHRYSAKFQLLDELFPRTLADSCATIKVPDLLCYLVAESNLIGVASHACEIIT
jgi:hypothetical protein